LGEQVIGVPEGVAELSRRRARHGSIVLHDVDDLCLLVEIRTQQARDRVSTSPADTFGAPLI
jgi:hypothetical protein